MCLFNEKYKHQQTVCVEFLRVYSVKRKSILFLQILGEYSHIQKEILPSEIVKELQSAFILPKISSTATTWILSAMLKISLRNPEAIADADISKMRQRIQTENMETVQVQKIITLADALIWRIFSFSPHKF